MADPAPSIPEPDARRRVLESVLDFPGLHVRAIARLLGASPSLVEYHAGQLLDAELITEAVHEGYRRFFPRPGPAGPSLADCSLLALLREEIPLHVTLLVLEADRPLPHKALAANVAVAKSTLSFHLAKMVEGGLIAKRSDGAYELVDAARVAELLVRWRPDPHLLSTHFALWLALYRRK